MTGRPGEDPPADSAGEPAHDPPLLRVVRGGEPSAEELAALVAVVAAAAPAATAAVPPPASRWADRAAALDRARMPVTRRWR